MNENELKRLGRRDLLELLLEISKENEQLRKRNSALEAQLMDRMLKISNAGSLADAVLQLNGVFLAAQEACDQYIYNVKMQCQKMEDETKNKCMEMLNQSKE